MIFILSMKRSTWASGSGYVPSCSIGFCVAMTRNRPSSGKVCSPMVTCRSCMASSKADWTFDGARLISSARMKLAKIGPLRVRNAPSLGHVDHRADQVGRQQVGGELDPLEAGREGLGQRLDGRGLGQPRHALQEDMPVGKQPHQQAGNHLLLPDDRLAQFGLEAMDQVRLFRDAVL